MKFQSFLHHWSLTLNFQFVNLFQSFMPSSWDVYYVVFLSAVLALGIPAILAAISYLVSPRRRLKSGVAPLADKRSELASPEGSPFALTPVENRVALGRRINARFFLGVNASLVLITLVLALIPCAGMIQPREVSSGVLLKGLIAIITIALFAILGLLYSARKGDLSWITSYQEGKRFE